MKVELWEIRAVTIRCKCGGKMERYAQTTVKRFYRCPGCQRHAAIPRIMLENLPADFTEFGKHA